MKLLAAWAVSASLIVAAVTAANAQMGAPTGVNQGRVSNVSDVDGPYTGAPPPPPMPPRPYGYGPEYGYGPQYGYAPPALMPLPDVYAVLRDNGFLPLGAPYQRGTTYVITAMDRGGEGGRLVIDARSGRIIRFMPAPRWGEAYGRMGYEMDYPPPGPIPPPTVIRGIPRPPASIPRVAGRTVPVPAPKPAVAGRGAEGAQQSVATETKPAAPAPQATTPPLAPNTSVVQAKPAPQILPTEKMPAAQGLD
jgi:hypothetical protein